MSKAEYLKNLIDLKARLNDMKSMNEYFYEIVLNIVRRQNEILIKFFEEKDKNVYQDSSNEDLLIEPSNSDEILVIYWNLNTSLHRKKEFFSKRNFDFSFKKLEKKDLTLRL